MNRIKGKGKQCTNSPDTKAGSIRSEKNGDKKKTENFLRTLSGKEMIRPRKPAGRKLQKEGNKGYRKSKSLSQPRGGGEAEGPPQYACLIY